MDTSASSLLIGSLKSEPPTHSFFQTSTHCTEERKGRKMTITIQNIDESYTTYTVTLNDNHNIHTTVTSSAADVEVWITETKRIHTDNTTAVCVGLDVEWRPSYGRAENPVALIQLCVGLRCLLFQILHADSIPSALSDFLSATGFRFVGVGIEEDVEKLICDCDLAVGNKVDLRVLAEEVMGRGDVRQMGLKKLASEVMKIEVQKPNSVRMSRWDNPFLSYEQIKYACIDAFLSFEIGHRLYAGEF